VVAAQQISRAGEQMRIKKVDLLGFKSFCDRTALNLQNNISCIVGPNGCGKSNIVDSLRWAMGEQSARHLRGKSMEDVIFNGSDSRGPSGVAEVSITFENDGRVPLEYMDYSEITVTRRLHRDGTSEYMMNKVPVRLRDITNLFLGTGVGTKAYSIIEQGRIGVIVSSRPEDRRHFIDEVAGITKYQRHKKAAERRMEATRQNLLRVSDVIEEISKRLGSLRRQAKKAERYKRYREEMKDIELWSCSHKLLQIIAEEKVEQEALQQALQRRDQTQAELDRDETRLESARMSAVEEERLLSGIQEELYALDNQIKLHENSIQFKTSESEDLQRRTEDAREEAKELRLQLGESEIHLARIREEFGTLSLRRDEFSSEVEAREARLRGLRQDLDQVHQALEEERGVLARDQRILAQGEAMQRALSQRRQDLAERVERRREELARVAERNASLDDSAKNLGQELSGLKSGAQHLYQHQHDLESRQESLVELDRKGEAELEVLRNELHRRRSRLTSLEEIEKRYEGFSRGTRAVMQKLNGTAQERGVLGLVADKINAPEGYEVALEAVLGQRLGTIIVESDNVGLEAIDYLKKNSEGRSSFIKRLSTRGNMLQRAEVGYVWEPPPAQGQEMSLDAGGGMSTSATPGVQGPMLGLIDFETEYSRVAENLLGDVLVVDNLEHALQIWDAHEHETLVTLEGEILGPDGILTGGSDEAERSGILRQKREIKELSGIIEEMEADYKEALDSHLEIKTEMASIEQSLAEIARQGHQDDKDILTREKDLTNISQEMKALGQRQQDLTRETGEINALQQELDQQESEMYSTLSQAAEEEHLARDIFALLGREEARLSQVVEGTAEEVTDVKVVLAELEGRWRSVDENIQSIEETRQDRDQRIRRLGRDADEALARSGALGQEVEALRLELEGLVTGRASNQQRLERRREGYEAIINQVGQQEVELKDVRNHLTQLGETINQQQLTLNELSINQRHLEEQVSERYRVQLHQVVCDHHMRSPVTEEQIERLAKLRQLIDRMGEINLTAIEEYEQLNERFEFLSGQREDLEGALGQLERAIQKINRTSRKRFKETFELVNKKFQEVFPRLFNGGRARLVLTDESNLLETGVDIIAQPPGKKLQSIDLLSGGEKALTAVSLIFSMFMIKPTPFCLLDEVDAPLDEANVLRFGEIVQEMASDSQFIIITHNRRTMEISEQLYGITMEEPGISRIVSVNLNEGQALVD